MVWERSRKLTRGGVDQTKTSAKRWLPHSIGDADPVTSGNLASPDFELMFILSVFGGSACVYGCCPGGTLVLLIHDKALLYPASCQ